ncbi:MAG: ribosome assembly RNA-binding protein YhbY [Sandaracinus sp.]|nr:ribosome assembly RNA-binding protein YhbY [Sandaracinus sp.]|tara:strand:+ start:338 stop:685 length:348 start_codon:yes stop_codon:yes gene_type:complete
MDPLDEITRKPERRPKGDLTGKQRKFLRAEAHHIDPLVRVGSAGLTAQVAEAASEALETHELIKVKVLEGAPVGRAEAGDFLTTECGAHLVGLIGRIAILYRRHGERPQIRLPSR